MPEKDHPPLLPPLDEEDTPVGKEATGPLRLMLRTLLYEHRENARGTLVSLADAKKQLKVVSDSVGYLRLRKNVPESLWKPLRVATWLAVANLAVLLAWQFWRMAR